MVEHSDQVIKNQKMKDHRSKTQRKEKKGKSEIRNISTVYKAFFMLKGKKSNRPEADINALPQNTLNFYNG